MNGRRTSILLAAVSALSLPACGASSADPFIGTYAYTEEHTFTITGPVMAPPMQGKASGTLTIEAGSRAGYVVTIDTAPDAGGGSCALDAEQGAGLALTFAAGQTCTVSGMGATGTATLKSGTGALAGTTLTLDLAYDIKGSSPMGSFEATTVDHDTATRE